MKNVFITLMLAVVTAVLYACGGSSSGAAVQEPAVDKSLLSKNMVNEAAYIPPQCYTVTEGENGAVYNPCYSCHKDSVRPNYINDSDLQLSYDFPAYALTNHWTNLFVDRTARVAAITDDEIKSYVRTSNYIDSDGNIILAQKLASVPAEWDYDGDGKWDGYVPDCYFNFDTEGFDRTPAGGYTGWRAFAYAPFLGTFWPTNGSTDDVIIKLDSMFSNNESGVFDIETYKINLAIVEALIKKVSITMDAVDETKYGVDLDKNGSLGTASTIKYEWAPNEGKYMYYVGQAKLKQQQGAVSLAAGLFPEKTEFLHSVRYINVTDEGKIGIAPRMKELRYAVKKKWYNYSQLELAAYEENKENYDFPDRLTEYFGDIEQGISNTSGWAYQGFIEAKDGSLRPQTYEETVFCMGCHKGIGATYDGVFTFSRKYDHSHFQKGWYHWSQKGLDGTPEHRLQYSNEGEQYEYSMYLRQNSAGDEFRGNEEVIAKFFNADGTIKEDMITALHSDVSLLLNPSVERALTLNKAYRTIVEDQSYIYGRDANVSPVANVHKTIEPQGKLTGIVNAVSAYLGVLLFD